LDRNKLFRRINIGLAICLGLFILFDRGFLGMGIIFTLMGTLSVLAFIYNMEPLGLSIGGFDYVMRSLLKEYYNRYFNMFWGLIELIVGLGILIKIFG
jgi:hypothetical protein